MGSRLLVILPARRKSTRTQLLLEAKPYASLWGSLWLLRLLFKQLLGLQRSGCSKYPVQCSLGPSKIKIIGRAVLEVFCKRFPGWCNFVPLLAVVCVGLLERAALWGVLKKGGEAFCIGVSSWRKCWPSACQVWAWVSWLKLLKDVILRLLFLSICVQDWDAARKQDTGGTWPDYHCLIPPPGQETSLQGTDSCCNLRGILEKDRWTNKNPLQMFYSYCILVALRYVEIWLVVNIFEDGEG